MLLARRKSKVVLLPVGIAVLVLALPSLSFTAPSVVSIGKDSTLWQNEGKSVLVVGEETSQRQLLEGLRRAGVKRLTLMIATGSDSKARQQQEALRSRYGNFEAWLPSQVGEAWRGLPMPQTRYIGNLAVQITETSPKLKVIVGFHELAGEALFS